MMNEKFPRDIKLEDSWFEYDYNKFQETLTFYRKALSELEKIEHDTNKPIPCKTWTKCYFYGDEPENLAKMWAEINDYIQEQSSKKGWTYSHIETEEVNVNTDPYDDWENLTEQYTVYAVVENREDFRQSEEYLEQGNVVSQYYGEVVRLKQRIDDRLKGE